MKDVTRSVLVLFGDNWSLRFLCADFGWRIFCNVENNVRRNLMFMKLKNKWLVGLACTACLFGACGFAAQGAVAANAVTSGSDNPSATQGVTAPFTQGSLHAEGVERV